MTEHKALLRGTMNKKIIVDFDGTICGSDFPDCGPPEPGVREALLELHDMGFEIVIHSCSTGTVWNGVEDGSNRLHHRTRIVTYMTLHDLYFDGVLMSPTSNKPLADFYIDDRGVSYKGNWPDVVNEIRKRQ